MCDRMSLHRPEVKVPSADSYSNSHVKVTKFRHIWTIENFSFLPTREVWLSPVFDAGTKDGVYWCAGIYPKNDYRPHSALFLYLVGQRKDDMLVNLEVSILTDEQEIIMKRFDDEPTSVGRGFCWIDTKSVFPSSEPNASILPDDRFTLSIKISYTPSNNEILTQCSQAESALLKCEYPGLPDGQIDKRTNSQVVLAASGRDFRAHKAIFAARFPTLKAIFEESPDDEQIRHLEIVKFPEDCLEELERFIYTGKTGDPERLKKIVAAIEKDVRNKSYVLLYLPPSNLRRAVSFGQLGEKINALPVLTDADIEKFRGDSTAFYEWWNEYCGTIHGHENLSTNFKLSCLGDLVKGEIKCADLPEENKEDIYFDRLANLFVRFGNIGATPVKMIRESLRMRAPFMGKKEYTETRLAIDIRLGALDLGSSFCWTADTEADKQGSSGLAQSAASKSDGIGSLMSTYEVVYDN